MLSADRAWAHLWMVVDALAIHLAHTGRLDEAALLLAGMDTHGRASVFLVLGRQRARAAVDTAPAVASSIAHGRSMDRVRLVDAAIACVSP